MPLIPTSSTAAPLPPPQPPEKRRLWRRRLIRAVGVLGVAWLTVASCGYWLSTDRVEWSGPADSVVFMGGYEQNRHAANWLAQGQVGEVWLLRPRDDLLSHIGIHEPSIDSSRAKLHALGVDDSLIRLLPVNADVSNIPLLIQAIGQATDRYSAQRVIVTCSPLQSRYLRQIADAALPPQQADRLRFVPLPHDEYSPTLWWTCRAGWKDLYGVSMQMMTNVYFGPTSGFETLPWNPDVWEARTFPGLHPVAP